MYAVWKDARRCTQQLSKQPVVHQSVLSKWLNRLSKLSAVLSVEKEFLLSKLNEKEALLSK